MNTVDEGEGGGKGVHIYRFGPDVGRPITHYNSDFIMARILRIAGSAPLGQGDRDITIGCMHLGAGGSVGFHQATVPQLFLTVAGVGWVAGTDRVRRPIRQYEAAFWERGEWHEAGSERGMTAIVIEGDGVVPRSFMPEA